MTKTINKKPPVTSEENEAVVDNSLIVLADLIIDTFLTMQRNKAVDPERRNVIKLNSTQLTG